MSMDDDLFKTVPPRPIPAKPRIIVRPNTGVAWKLFGLWAWSPIISFQVGLTAGYAALIYFGIASGIANPPSFKDTSPDGYAYIWAIALTIGAMVSVVGSVSRNKRFEILETIGSSLLTATVGSYVGLLHFIAYSQGDTARIAVAAGFTALAVPIIVRTMWLYSQLLRK